MGGVGPWVRGLAGASPRPNFYFLIFQRPPDPVRHEVQFVLMVTAQAGQTRDLINNLNTTRLANHHGHNGGNGRG